MNLLKNPFPQKITVVFIVLLLSACGGTSATREAVSPTAELQSLADNTAAQTVVVAPVPNPLNPADPTDIASTNDIASAGASAAASAAAGEPVFVNAGLPGIADVFIGTIDLPYYFDPTNSLTSFWSTPIAVVDTLTVPVMMTLPNAGSGQVMPPEGWPIVMYQHGITRFRTDVIVYADAQAQAGFAMIAIDLPTHGIVDPNNPFNASNTAFPNDVEQTFGVNATSGQNFINIPSLLTSRDNVRQGAANLLTLRRSLGNIVSLATGAPVPLPIDTTRVGLIGHSLGAIVSIPYLGVETTRTPSSILMGGATITTVLQESATFGPVIAAGLAPLGIVTPEDINDFYISAQQTIDSGEPVNYAAAAAANHPLHFVEIIGDGGANLPDQVVPNSATENLASIVGANSISTTTPGIAAGNPGIVRFIEGAHGSPLDPTSSPAVTFEIQSQIAVFQATNGTVIQITNGNVIQ